MRPYFDVYTLLIYVSIGILGVVFIQRNNTRESIWNCFFFILIFAVLATFRLVGNDVGGIDAPEYIDLFNHANMNGVGDRAGSTSIEPGFLYLNIIIRKFTDSWRLYFFVIYAFIAFSYFYFIKKMCPKGISVIPFVLLAFLFVKGFNTIRTHVAISILLIGISYIDRRKCLSLFLMATSIMIHRLSLLFLPIWFFYYVMKKIFPECSRIVYFTLGISGMVISLLASRYLQDYIMIAGLMDGTDAFYLTKKQDANILDSYPMFFAQVLLFLIICLYYNKIKWEKKSNLLKTLFLYDLCIIPAALTLGMWRFVNYLYVVRLCLWAVVMYNMEYYILKVKRQFIALLLWVIFIGWFAFRFSREWSDTGISPYIFDVL